MGWRVLRCSGQYKCFIWICTFLSLAAIINLIIIRIRWYLTLDGSSRPIKLHIKPESKTMQRSWKLKRVFNRTSTKWKLKNNIPREKLPINSMKNGSVTWKKITSLCENERTNNEPWLKYTRLVFLINATPMRSKLYIICKQHNLEGYKNSLPCPDKICNQMNRLRKSKHECI